MSLDPAKRNATYQDVLDAPPNVVAELLEGSLFLRPRPAKPEAEAAFVLGMLLGPPLQLGQEGPDGWVIQHQPELHLDGNVLVPDLAGWRRSSAPNLDLESAFYTESPDWVCEVLSPETRRKDRTLKLPLYAAAGIHHAWLVDPGDRTVETYRNESHRWVMLNVYAEHTEARVGPFDSGVITFGKLWGSTDKTTTP